jgi:hypothetical protein
MPTANAKEVRESQATKAAYEDESSKRMEDARAGKYGTPEPKDVDEKYKHQPVPVPIETVQAQTVPSPPGGIGIVQAPMSSWIGRYHVENMWEGMVNGIEAYVYAGSKADVAGKGRQGVWNDPEQGVLLLNTKGKGEDADYLTPTRTGRIKLQSANGTCLTVVSSNGTIYTFDVSTAKWSCETKKSR